MDNEILRVKNYKDDEKNLNSSSFKSASNNLIKNNKNSIVNFVQSEIKESAISKTETVLLTRKPKILNSIFLALSFILASVILALFCFFTKEIYFAVLLAVISSITIPLSLTLFFKSLDTRSNYPLLSSLKTFGCGALAFCVLEVIFTSVSSLTNYYGNILTLTRCLTDMVLIILITTLLYKHSEKTGTITLMYIACTVACGFSAFKSFTYIFNSLFIKVQIFDGQSLSVGAIINTGDWAKRSITALFKATAYYGLYQPLIFTALNVIIGFSLNYYFDKKTRATENKTSNLLIIITCLLINALISVSTSIIFFEIIYNVCAVLFTAYMFYEVLDYSIKNEKYKD